MTGSICIYADMEIHPTLEDKIKENDTERNWILNDLKTN